MYLPRSLLEEFTKKIRERQKAKLTGSRGGVAQQIR
jgi:hypothetical protein